MRAALLFLEVALGLALMLVLPAAGVASSAPPLIGVTYTHSNLLSCDLHGSTGIVAHYNDPGERRLVRAPLGNATLGWASVRE